MLSKSVLIPSRHLLTMSIDDFHMLTRDSFIWQEKIVYFRLPKGINSLSEYYYGIRHNITNLQQKDIEERINRLNTIFENNFSSVEKYSPEDQMIFYSSKIKQFIALYEKHKGIHFIKEQIENEELITKDWFDALIHDCFKNKVITKDTYKRLKKASLAIYLIAGASVQSLKVCYDKCFEYPCIHKELVQIFNEYDSIINKNYEPEQIFVFLRDTEIIKNKKDIKNLTWNKMQLIRKNSFFNEALFEYEKLSSLNKEDSTVYVQAEKKRVSVLEKVKDIIISFLIAIVCGLISGLWLKGILLNIAISIFSLFATYWLERTFNIFKLHIPVIEKCIYSIIGKKYPLSVYLLSIKQII